jgi:tripartite-type tricarboxylate transporter receptor subunit TctC
LIATEKLRAIAVTAPTRVVGLKDVPTVVEQDFPELVVEDYVGFAVKRGTSSEIVARLNQAIDRALLKPKVRDAFAKLGAEPAGGSPAVFGALIEAQVAHWGRVVREAGITSLNEGPRMLPVFAHAERCRAPGPSETCAAMTCLGPRTERERP